MYIYLEFEKLTILQKKQRAEPDLNRRPIDLQSIALPLSYQPMIKVLLKIKKL